MPTLMDKLSYYNQHKQRTAAPTQKKKMIKKITLFFDK
jgi:hypothetical protein